MNERRRKNLEGDGERINKTGGGGGEGKIKGAEVGRERNRQLLIISFLYWKEKEELRKRWRLDEKEELKKRSGKKKTDSYFPSQCWSRYYQRN